MPPKFKEFLLRWANTTVGVVLANYLVRGIHANKLLDLIVAALMLGILNAFLRPVLMFLTLPLLLFTLGLFTLVINALLLYLVGWLLRPNFDVVGFWPAFWGALVITIVSAILNRLTGTSRVRGSIRVNQPHPPRNPPDGGGPVIDV